MRGRVAVKVAEARVAVPRVAEERVVVAVVELVETAGIVPT
jgi:hypothetical protein